MPACRNCRYHDAPHWDPDQLCPKCRAVEQRRLAATQRRQIANDTRTPSLPGLALSAAALPSVPSPSCRSSVP